MIRDLLFASGATLAPIIQNWVFEDGLLVPSTYFGVK
jgi:hypothetical protein